MALPLLLFSLLAGQDAVSTAPADAPAAAPAPTQAEYTPEGAPKDDYNFTAWCHGVLSGHMALAERVQSVLPLDEVQQKIGKAYLKGYEEALATGKRSRSAAEIDAADAVRAAARANWTTAMKADLQLGADTYLAWQLPGRCEHAAIRVAGRADLFRMAPSLEEVETLGGTRDSGMAEAPAPVRTAAPATAPVVAAPVMTQASSPAPEEETAALAPPMALPDYTSIDLGAPAPAPAEVPTDTFAAAPPPEPEAVAESAPEEVQMAEAAPEPTPALEEPAPTAETPPRTDGRIITMPRKGRLFPWGKRE